MPLRSRFCRSLDKAQVEVKLWKLVFCYCYYTVFYEYHKMAEGLDSKWNIRDGTEELQSPWVLYENRQEWDDVTPVPQDDGPHPIVAIAYTERCEYFILFLKFLLNECHSVF